MGGGWGPWMCVPGCYIGWADFLCKRLIGTQGISS